MDSNIQAFFSLLRAGLWEKDVHLLSEEKIDYLYIFQLAEEQAVVGLVAAIVGIISAVKFRQAQHNMYFSDNPTTVMISYILLAEIEVLNLITIVEGIRYSVDKNIISSLLYY